MSFLLDTNACINHLRLGVRSRVTARLLQVSSADIFLCSIVKAELLYGARQSQQVKQNLEALDRFFEPFVSLAFDDDAAGAYGEIRSAMAARKLTMGPNDLMIASIAISRSLTLVTHDVGEFSRVPGLKIEDWESAKP